jgi:hypothetical protein
MRRGSWTLLALAAGAVLMTGCGGKTPPAAPFFGGSVHASRTSPWQSGYEIRFSPSFVVADSENVTAHPTVAYERAFFSGGHDNNLHFGGQVRSAPERFQGRLRGLWLGGEGAFARRSTVVTDPLAVEDNEDGVVANGWRVGVLFGMPVFTGSRGSLHFSTSVGVIKFGGMGPSIRFGLEFQPKRRGP